MSIWHLNHRDSCVQLAVLHACPLSLQRRNRADCQHLQQLQAARGCDSLDKGSTCANNSSGSDSAWRQADVHHGSVAEPDLQAGQAIAAVPICLATLCQARRMRPPSRHQSTQAGQGALRMAKPVGLGTPGKLWPCKLCFQVAGLVSTAPGDDASAWVSTSACQGCILIVTLHDRHFCDALAGMA